jgi:DNA polymerase-1
MNTRCLTFCTGGRDGPMSSYTIADLPFREVWLVDFEFCGDPGDRPIPVCLVAKEFRTGRVIRLWQDEFGAAPPYPTGPETLFVAYYASAEIGCHLALDWPVPARVLDLYAEFRCLTNGLAVPCGSGLIGALVYQGLETIGTDEKHDMRDLILGGGPWSVQQQDAILAYCLSDVAGLAQLMPAMLPKIDLPRALLRGRSMVAAALIERAGVPIDTVTLDRLRRNWNKVQDQLIQDIDADFGVFVGRTFKADRFTVWLERAGIPWPRLWGGALDLSEDAFREMARVYPVVAPLRELRTSLAKLRLNDLAVGSDGRNRVLLSAFRARTGRNQPSNAKFIFGPATWLRGLIQPAPGNGVAYIDWSQQEFGIAAALSRDPLMMDAYRSGDPYLEFAKQADAAPPQATKHSHKSVRDQFKDCVLAVQYGMGAESLAHRIGQPTIRARELLRLHRDTYRVFWGWSDRMLDNAMLTGVLHTVFGWPLHVPPDANDRSLRNFPMQANGAEMLRLACCLATERGIEVCAPVHDAVLVVAPLDRIEADIVAMQQVMAEASHIVLDGFELRSDVAVTRHPDRYMDERGQVMWDRVMALLAAGDADRDQQVLRRMEHPCCPVSNTPDLELKPAEILAVLAKEHPKPLHKVQHPSLFSN